MKQIVLSWSDGGCSSLSVVAGLTRGPGREFASLNARASIRASLRVTLGSISMLSKIFSFRAFHMYRAAKGMP